MSVSAAASDSDSAQSSSSHASSQLLLSMNDFANFKQIGKGKDCVVYAASCEKLGGHTVVLKVYQRDKISAIKQRSIRREARIMRYLTDKRIPHTTAYTGAFQDSKQIYIVMEHCQGGDLLEQLLREGRAMPEKRVVREVVLPTLTALAHLHAAGIIHRDIKLENLFISSRGHLQLGDFGLAISVLEERAISPVGTLEYMAPEILRLPATDLVLKGLVKVDDIVPINEKVDLWSFGVTVYELVTGRSPFEGSSKDQIKVAILGFDMRPLPGFLTPSCKDFILKCLSHKAADRPSALTLLSHPWVQMHCTPTDIVTIARLPMQLPKTPMGQKHASKPWTQAAPQQQQQQVVSASSISTTITAGAATATAVEVTSPAVLTSCEKQGATLRRPEAKIHSTSSSVSSPDSPQIPAFLPPGASAAKSSTAAMSAAAACTHAGADCRTSSSHSSACSTSSSMQPAPGATHSHDGPSIDHSVSTDSTRSHGPPSTRNSVASTCQQAAAANVEAASSPCQPGLSAAASCKVKDVPAGVAVSTFELVQEPIQESPADELAAAAASTASLTGGVTGGVSLQQQQQQQAAQKLHAAPLPVRTPPQDMPRALRLHLSPSKGVTAEINSSKRTTQKQQKSSGKRLWKWVCAAAGTTSHHASAS